MVATNLLSLFAGLLSLVSAQNYSAAGTYTNPVLNQVGADPFVVKEDGYYYLTYTTATNITILRSSVAMAQSEADAIALYEQQRMQPDQQRPDVNSTHSQVSTPHESDRKRAFALVGSALSQLPIWGMTQSLIRMK